MLWIYSRVSPLFRRKRMRRMVDMMGVSESTTVLDVGGSWANWDLLDFRPRVIRLNMEPGHADVVGDGRMLPFPDRSFDLVFCNSVIEHVGTRADQQRLADEITRVGRAYYVQTPDFWFPIETHLIGPFIHWLPRWAQPFAAIPLSIRGWISPCEAMAVTREVRLLKRSSLLRMFPTAVIVRERLLGLPKSLIARSSARIR